jgi:hypothetical protein
VNRSAARGLARKRKTTKRPRTAPMYLIARGPEPCPIASIGHDDKSRDWELTIAPLGSPPTKVPVRPANIRREVREWLATDSQSFREANARGVPLTPFPPTPPPPTTAQKAAALEETALRKARERSYEPGRLGTGAFGGYLEALRELIGDGRGTMAGVGHKGVPRLLRDAFLAESHYREHRERAGSLKEWMRLAAREGLNFHASVSFQDEDLSSSHKQEILRGLKRRARTFDEDDALTEMIRTERNLARARGTAALGNRKRGRPPGARTRDLSKK